MGYPLITCGTIRVDFDRHFNVWKPARIESKAVNEAASGKTETLTFYERWKVEAAIRRLKGETILQLEAFYRAAKDGTSFSMWWDRSLGLCAFFEDGLYTIDGDTGTFSRSVAAHYVGRDGLLKETASGTPRYPSGKFGGGLLLEGSSANALLYSEQFDHATWVKTNVTVSANTTDIDDPKGENNADKCTATANNGTIVQTLSGAVGTNDACLSVWMRAAVGCDVTLTITDDAGSFTESNEYNITSEWVRYELAYENTGASNPNNWKVQITLDNNGDIVYLYGVQLEGGAHKRYATGYMKTEATIATRLEEQLVYTIIEGRHFNRLKGLISFWEYHNWEYDEGGGGGDDPVRVMLQITDLSDNPVLTIYRNDSSKLIVKIEDLAGNDYTAESVTNLPHRQWNHIAFAWDITDRIYTPPTWHAGYLYLNGSGENWMIMNDEILPPTPTKLYLGNSAAGSQEADFIIDDLMIYLEADGGIGSTNTTVSRIYNAGRSLGLRRNYFSDLQLADNKFSPTLLAGGKVYDFELIAEEVL